MTTEEFMKDKPSADLDKVVTIGLLLEYTQEVLLPGIDRMFEKSEARIKQEMGKLEYNLKTYVDRKLTDHTDALFKRLDAKYQKEKQFHEKVVELFRKHHIGTPEDVAFLEGLSV